MTRIKLSLLGAAIAIALGAALIAVLLAVGSLKNTDENILNARKAGRVETCKFIDAEHDRTRKQIAESERQITGPLKHLFDLTAAEREHIHGLNKKRYDHVIDTRPSYCPPRTPIEPYPAI